MTDRQEAYMLVFLCVLIIGALSFLVLTFDAYSCGQKATAMNVEYSWSVGTECMIKVDGKWTPIRNYRTF